VIDKIKRKITWVKSSNFLAGLALFFASLLFFYDLFDGRNLLTERDLGPYFIPPRFFWVESIKQGDFPLWNPYQFSGHPFFANPQHAILYPLNTLFFLLPFDVAFNAIIILHFFLGGLFTYLFLKDLKANTTGSLISGLVFMLSGYLLSVHSLLNTLLSVIWTPLIMMYFRRAILSPGLKNEILTSVFITISFLGGGIEVVYGNFIILLSMVIFFSPDGETQRRGQWKKICLGVRSLLIISILFFLLSAVQLLPFLELFHHSIRGSGISYQEATTWSLAPKDVILFFLPDAYGYFLDMKKYWINQCWFKTLYTGGLPFILSLIFFLSSEREKSGMNGLGKSRKFYLFLMIFSIFLALGKYNPFYLYVFKYIPFFNGLRYPVKFLYIFILVLSITAGLGFQRLTESLKESGGRRLKNILIIFSLIFGLFLLFLVINHNGIEQFLKLRKIDFPDFNYLSVNLFHIKRFFFYIALFFLLLRIGDGVRWKGWAKLLLIFFLTADLFGNMGYYGKEKTSDYFEKNKILEIISSDQGDFRIVSTPKTTSFDTPILIAKASHLDILKEKSLPSLNVIYRLHDIWGIDVIHLKRVDDLYKAFTSTPSISTTNLLDLYSVKYIVSITPLGENPRFELVYAGLEGLQGRRKDLLKENTIKLYRYRNAFPRGFFVKDFNVMEDSRKILSAMIRKKFDPRKEVYLEERPTWTVTEGRPYKNNGLTKKVKFISESNNRLQLLVRTRKKGLLVLSDTYFPGWKVFVNGKKEKVYRANYNFRSIPLKAGKYDIQFIYDPITFKIGIFVSLFTLAGIIIYFVKKMSR
jgi:hypothetical protein